jgi:hypothetical protein
MDDECPPPSQEYLNKVSPVGNALTEEQSARLRDLPIAEGRIGDALGSLEDFITDLEGEVYVAFTPRPRRQKADGANTAS